MAFKLFALLGVIALVSLKLRNAGRRPKDIPPGPPTLPIIGNLHLMPAEQPHHQFKKWADEYGPVYSLMLGSTVMIVLTSDQAVKDLLDKRSNIYSSRPPLHIGQICSGGLRMLFMQYGETWRMIRKTVHAHLNIKAAKSYIPYQDLENRNLLIGFLDQSDRWEDHIRRYTNALTAQMIFGFRTTSIDDPTMIRLFQCVEGMSHIVGSLEAKLIDAFPWLQHLPEALLPIKRKAREHHAFEREAYVGHWMDVKEKIQNGTANPCICIDLFESQKREGFSDPLAGYTCSSLFEAGSDTTYSQIVGFVQAMVLFPKVQQKGKEEIERVCGDRLPTLEDEPNMQYIRSTIKESLRWMPTPILGVPHGCIQDNMYMGYRIPKDSSVMLNVWGIHHDESRFPNPRVFNPDRYMDNIMSTAEAATHPEASKRDQYVFGAGRRVCQGMHIAERSLFLAVSRLLWAFDFKPALDDDKNPIIPDPNKLTEGFLVLPQKFPISITPRSEERAAGVRKEWAKWEDKLDENKQWKKIPEGMFSK